MKDIFRPVDNFRTIRNNYLLVEIREGFDEFELGNTGIEIKIGAHEGVGGYTNFSKHCRVIAAPEGGKYKVGASVWVTHLIKDTMTDGRKISESLKGVDVMYCHEDNILFECENLLELESDEWMITQAKPKEEKEVGGFIVVEGMDDFEAYVICGAMEKGKRITWWEQVPRVELFQKEVQYWAVHKENVTSVDGKPYGEFYRVDTFNDMEYEYRGVTLKGMTAKMAELGVERMKGCVIGRLENPDLEHHGCTCLVRKPKRKSLIHQSQVHAILSPA